MPRSWQREPGNGEFFIQTVVLLFLFFLVAIGKFLFNRRVCHRDFWTIFRCKVEINGDLGPAVDKILRVSLMGNNAQPSVVDLVLRVLDEGLQHAVVSKL